jgi:hypothetical protein
MYSLRDELLVDISTPPFNTPARIIDQILKFEPNSFVNVTGMKKGGYKHYGQRLNFECL